MWILDALVALGSSALFGWAVIMGLAVMAYRDLAEKALVAPMPEIDWTILSKFGSWGLTTSLAFVIIYGALKQHWVPGAYYRQIKQERDDVRGELVSTTKALADATKVVERVTAGWKPPQ